MSHNCNNCPLYDCLSEYLAQDLFHAYTNQSQQHNHIPDHIMPVLLAYSDRNSSKRYCRALALVLFLYYCGDDMDAVVRDLAHILLMTGR